MIESQKSHAVQDGQRDPMLHLGKDIERLLSCFKCEGENLHFAIQLQMKNSTRLITILKTSDRMEFRTMFNHFINIRHENRAFYLPPL